MPVFRHIAALATLLIGLLASTGFAQSTPVATQPPEQPEAASGFHRTPAVTGRRQMAVTANPYASKAAFQMLEQGGSALDAAIAAQMVLTLVEPQSSGIGGGAFLLYHDARSRRVSAWDGRETAPAAASDSLFFGTDGKPLTFFDAVVGGRSVGAPGVVRMLEAAHARHGRLDWAKLFEPAIRLAREGFEISPRLHALLSADRHLRSDPTAGRYFLDPDGKPWPVGHRLRNPDLADSLAQIANRGSLALHAGPIARDIVAAVQSHPRNPGLLTEHDLAFYRPIERNPLCVPWQQWVVCGMPPPSSGGLAVAQILGILQALGSPTLASRDQGWLPGGAHAFSEAMRLAFADRNQHVADPDFVANPPGLLQPGYLTRRAARIGSQSMGTATPGIPPQVPVSMRLPSAGASDSPTGQPVAALSLEQPSTSHLSIVDRWGNAVSMTTTIEDQFGARLMVRGFLLNNQLSDFSFSPRSGDALVANRVEPGKRPRSSMAPTLVFERHSQGGAGPLQTGRLVMVLGSPGGAQIIGYVARTLVATLQDGLDLQTAIDLPNLGSRNGPTELEVGQAPASLAAALRHRGHDLRFMHMTSGLHAIVQGCNRAGRCTLTGAADPRREGLAIGR